MGQRVEFAALPGTRYDQYVLKLQSVVSFLQTPGAAKFKPLRDQLRKMGLWDKDKAEVMFSLVDVTWDRKDVQLGRLARAIGSAGSDSAVQDLLYRRLCDANILLVKYVLEALDVDSGGRLHSVHELYRMITSYVYPGAYITLPNFQAWIEWLAATGYIKLVGIRWALSDKGLKVLPELKSMDVEEILEDLEEEAEDEGDEDEDDDVDAPDEDDDAGDEDATPAGPVATRPASTARPVAAPTPAPAKARAAAAPDDELDDEWADLPPEPEPPSANELAAAQAAFEARFADVAVAEAEPPEPEASAATGRPVSHGAVGLHAPLPNLAAAYSPAVIAASAEARVVAEQLVGWWKALGDWPALTAADLGVEVEPPKPDPRLLLELSVLAVLVEGQRPRPQVFAFVGRLMDAGFFDAFEQGGLGPALERLGDWDGQPWMRPFVERLVHAAALGQRIADAPELLEQLRDVTSGREAIGVLRGALFGERWVEAPFWTLRELLRLGVLEEPELASAAVVPSRRLVANAYRVGLVPRPEVTSFEGLLQVAEATAALFGETGAAASGYGEALEVMDRGLGLETAD